MKKITIYMTSSLGGAEGKEIEKRIFEIAEAAKQNALIDT